MGIAGFSPASNPADSIMYSWCRKLVSFTPEADSNYEALYDYVELPNGKEACGVTLFEIVENNQGDYSKVEVSDYKVVGNYCD